MSRKCSYRLSSLHIPNTNAFVKLQKDRQTQCIKGLSPLPQKDRQTQCIKGLSLLPQKVRQTQCIKGLSLLPIHIIECFYVHTYICMKRELFTLSQYKGYDVLEIMYICIMCVWTVIANQSPLIYYTVPPQYSGMKHAKKNRIYFTAQYSKSYTPTHSHIHTFTHSHIQGDSRIRSPCINKKHSKKTVSRVSSINF